jgi:hypothetical protein
MNKNSFWCGAIALIALAAFSGAAQSPQVAAAIEKIPSSARTTKDFAPRGLEINNEATGDLNGDNISDAALTLTVPLDELEGQPGRREYDSTLCIVVVAFGKAGGGYRLFAVNGRLFPPDADDRSYLSNSIEKGVLIINTNWGDGMANDITYRFRFDKNTGKMLLIGFDQERYDRTRNDGSDNRSSENYVTGLRIDYARVKEGYSSPREVGRKKISRRVVTFEDAHITQNEDEFEYRPY